MVIAVVVVVGELLLLGMIIISGGAPVTGAANGVYVRRMLPR